MTDSHQERWFKPSQGRWPLFRGQVILTCFHIECDCIIQPLLTQRHGGRMSPWKRSMGRQHAESRAAAFNYFLMHHPRHFLRSVLVGIGLWFDLTQCNPRWSYSCPGLWISVGFSCSNSALWEWGRAFTVGNPRIQSVFSVAIWACTSVLMFGGNVNLLFWGNLLRVTWGSREYWIEYK